MRARHVTTAIAAALLLAGQVPCLAANEEAAESELSGGVGMLGSGCPTIRAMPRFSKSLPRPDLARSPAEHQPELPVTDFEKEVQQKLAEKVSVAYLDTPLSDVLDEFSERRNLKFLLDATGLLDEGISLDEPVTLQLQDVSAKAALEAILHRIGGLTWHPQEPFVVVTTQIIAEERLWTKFYDVADLVLVEKDGKLVPQFDPLVHLLQNQTAGPWEEIEGIGGTVSELELPGLDALAIRQTYAVHEEVAALLTGLRSIESGETLSLNNSVAESTRQALEQQVSVDFQDVPLREVGDWLQKKLGRPVLIDENGLADEGIATDEPIRFAAEDVRLRDVIEQIFEPIGLTWVTRFDSLFVTTLQEAEEKISPTLYEVSDLVTWQRVDGERQWLTNNLVDAIQNETSGPWEEIEGIGGTISEFLHQDLNVLVIRQTREVHEEIANLLAELRRLQIKPRETAAETDQ